LFSFVSGGGERWGSGKQLKEGLGGGEDLE